MTAVPTDMLVRLYYLPFTEGDVESAEKRLAGSGVFIKRPLAADKATILTFVKDTFSTGWADECDVTFCNKHVSCFVAVKDRKVIGFCCHEATAKGFVGPMGVSGEFRGLGIGTVLLWKCLLAMREEGYAYAVIGWVNEALEFYRRSAGAEPIEGSFPGIYGRLISK